MSTVFTLLGANATTVDQKVKRIVELEEDFILGVGKFLNIHLYIYFYLKCLKNSRVYVFPIAQEIVAITYQ